MLYSLLARKNYKRKPLLNRTWGHEKAKEKEDRIPLLSGSRRHDTSKQKQKSKALSLWGGLCSGRAAHLLCRGREAIVNVVVVQQLLPCSAKRAAKVASQFNLSKLFCAQRDGTYAQCSFSLLLIFFFSSSSSSPPPKQQPPASELLLFQGGKRRLSLLLIFCPTVWFYDRCVGDAFS